MYSVHVIKNLYYDIVENNIKSNGGGEQEVN